MGKLHRAVIGVPTRGALGIWGQGLLCKLMPAHPPPGCGPQTGRSQQDTGGARCHPNTQQRPSGHPTCPPPLPGYSTQEGARQLPVLPVLPVKFNADTWRRRAGKAAPAGSVPPGGCVCGVRAGMGGSPPLPPRTNPARQTPRRRGSSA